MANAAPAAISNTQEYAQFEAKGLKYNPKRPAAAIHRIHLSVVPTFFFIGQIVNVLNVARIVDANKLKDKQIRCLSLLGRWGVFQGFHKIHRSNYG